MQEVTA